VIQAGAFLGWLDVRGCLLPHCGQADLDAWHTENYATRRPAQALSAVAHERTPHAQVIRPIPSKPRCTSISGSARSYEYCPPRTYR
jgi:hypothetical protein